MDGVKEFLYVRTFVTPSLFTYSIGMAIYCQFKVKKIAIILIDVLNVKKSF